MNDLTEGLMNMTDAKMNRGLLKMALDDENEPKTRPLQKRKPF